MTRQQEIRQEILLQLYNVRPIAMSAPLISRQARKAGLDYTPIEVKQECAFLVGQKLADLVIDPVSGETKFSLSSQGVLHYENAQ
jgi:hypothetical protein